jgi:RNA polymerase sigma-70 factor, ECF subfamily
VTDLARDADERLAERIRSGDSSALGELYDRYGAHALAVAQRVVGAREEAEDVVHDAFVAVWRKIDRFDPTRGSLRAWLMTIVRNRGVDRLRARRPSLDIEDADERSLLRSGPNPTWEAVIERTSVDELRSAISTLPGYTYRQVAELTGVPAGTANGRMRLALSKLRESLTGGAAAPMLFAEAPITEDAR